MSATRMLVLGVIHQAGRAHGYQVRTELISWKADEWARIKPGSIYHAIRKAVADGLLEPEAAEQGAGPDRVVYRMTAAGDAELIALIREGLGGGRDLWMLHAAVSLLNLLARPVAIELVETRIVELEASLEALRAWRDEPIADHSVELALLWTAQATATLAWARDLRAKLADGAYRLAK